MVVGKEVGKPLILYLPTTFAKAGRRPVGADLDDERPSGASPERSYKRIEHGA